MEGNIHGTRYRKFGVGGSTGRVGVEVKMGEAYTLYDAGKFPSLLQSYTVLTRHVSHISVLASLSLHMF